MKKPISQNYQFIKCIWVLLLVAGFSSVASAATFTVTKVADTNDNVCDADCSLREAIAAANVATTDDIIEFSSFFSSSRSIRLTGGELSIANNGTLTINGTGMNMLSISGERLSRVFYINGATVTVKGLVVTLGSGAGTSGGAGGGIYNLNGTLNLINAGVNSNTASTVGGAIYSSGAVSIVNSTVGYNSALNGGGIYNNGGSVIVQSSIINNNSASSGGGQDGGGIFNSGGSAVLTVTDSTVRANGARFGGGIYNVVGTLTATNTTFTNNGATVGGGISNNSGTVNLNNVTVARNSVSDLTVGGGGISTGNGGAVNARNSIIADNTAPTNTAPDFAGMVTSQGYNLIGNTTGTTIVGTNVGNILGQNAFLAPPGTNGAVSDFIALLSFSPAIDAADPSNFPAADQRGVPRPQDGDLNETALPDIGAYERRPALFTVTKTDDTNDGACNADCSLREAIAAVNTSNLPDKMIAFETAAFATPRIITITGGQLTVAENVVLAIKGTAANQLTISGNNTSRIIFSSVGAILALSNVTLTGGGNTVSSGGAIFSTQGSTLSIKDSIISGNNAADGGGLVCTGRLYLDNSIITNNSALGSGGGIYGNTLFINNSVISNNTAVKDGGGVFALFNTNINNSFVTGNATTGNDIQDEGGGGIYVFGGQMFINNSTVSNNSTNLAGGGLYNTERTSIVNSTFSHNSSRYGGGGMNNSYFGTINVTNSTISNNVTNLDGGGLHNSVGSGVTSLTNSTVANNRAGRDGGGVFNYIGNGGIINSRNSIIARNSATNSAPDVKNYLTSQDYNLIENINGANITGATSNNIYGQDPQLLPLGNYGGATQTHALKPSSPAIDKGNSFGAATDQRGRVRPFDFPLVPNASNGNGTDIGAYERQPNDVSSLPMFDFDGDGRADVSVFRPSNGTWYVNQSTAGFTGIAFGAAGDKIVPADYDGDGKTDVAVFRAGVWYLQRSAQGFTGVAFGAADDIPVPADYDGDGRADIAVFRQSTGVWYLQRSNLGFIGITFGQTGDKPVAADYDGDGKADIAVYRSGTWYIQRSQLGFTGIAFGEATDKPVLADYDGDGKADVAVFRPSNGTWYLQRSQLGFTGIAFGLGTDLPVPADYDGDGKTDVSVFREGSWYLQRTQAGFTGVAFGETIDKPIPNAFVP